MPRKKIDALVEYAKGFGAKGLAYLAIHEDGSYKCSFGKFMKQEELDALVKAMDGKPGDLLFFAADKNKVVFDVLGNLRLEIARQLDLLKKDDFKFLWVTEFPLLEYSEEEGRYVAMHHPFTMPMEEDLPLIDTDPGAVRAKAYDIVLTVRSSEADPSVSIRMIFRRRCLKCSALQKSRHTASLDSFLMRLNMEFRLMQDLLTVWIVSLCLWQNRTAFVM